MILPDYRGTRVLDGLDCNLNCQAFGASGTGRSADRSGVLCVKARAQTDIVFVGATPVCGIKPDPAQTGQKHLGPGVGGFMRHTVRGGEQIA